MAIFIYLTLQNSIQMKHKYTAINGALYSLTYLTLFTGLNMHLVVKYLSQTMDNATENCFDIKKIVFDIFQF